MRNNPTFTADSSIEIRDGVYHIISEGEQVWTMIPQGDQFMIDGVEDGSGYEFLNGTTFHKE
ncbi:MAG: hypothetical protein HFG41_12590 [Coprococcus sp.]|nr:hypothetical protein [Coprococcus sp.]